VVGFARCFNIGADECSCKPQLAHTILGEAGLKEALDGKLLISILAGVTMAQINAWVLPSTKVIRAMPNTPCKVPASPSLYNTTIIHCAPPRRSAKA
jgi:pyrroline-5-carboxylate reductase